MVIDPREPRGSHYLEDGYSQAVTNDYGVLRSAEKEIRLLLVVVARYFHRRVHNNRVKLRYDANR